MKIGFIGAGNMGGAILRGYLTTTNINREDVFVSEQNQEKAEQLKAELGITPAKDIAELVALCDVILLGVKPNNFETVLPLIAEKYSTDKVLVSMAAGIEMSFIEKYLGAEAKIVRIMPNTPAMVNEAMVAVCRNANVSDEEFAPVFHIFKAIGKAEEVPESLIHCVIGVSGSSPAYTYMYIDALAEAAVKNGMAKEQAIIFAAQSVLGAAKMVLETGVDPVQLRINVCSPGGATIEAVTILQQNGFEKNIAEGFQAAVEKSKMMTKN
ncbi:pyrroline-5-carboxylate reductase [Clostridium aminobutyricum]|uniref:Pyrroline-5-carboxylate reductase n=1 Tax=Clostridium aminobutyricum TaxID=33953 RepID=A0A939D6E9_CLOAM|nr:pyrroline-5-carboxylate reductase [Clostridium aminobutyricum]MBN7771886.1 pyrroline-5-carboxylate reductase [Clostridium aminobutyricum]